MTESRTHLLIPDCQVQAGPEYITDHLGWIGQYWLDHRSEIDATICIGDFSDMSSLSSFDRGKKSAEGRRIVADFEATRAAMATLLGPLTKYNAKRRRHHDPIYRPEMHLTLGNHEHRIDKATEDRADLDGVISTRDLGYEEAGWTVHPFLDVLQLDGLAYSHYFYNTGNGRAISGNIETRLRAIGASFVQGHQQQLAWGMRYVMGRPQMGLVAGACYLGRSPAEYRGPQAEEWRGIVMLRNVADGGYDLETVSLSTLCERYEGRSLAKFTQKLY
jgi:hypothetical protein